MWNVIIGVSVLVKVGETPYVWGGNNSSASASSANKDIGSVFPNYAAEKDPPPVEVKKKIAAPNNKVIINGKEENAAYVVSLKENKLYKYDDKGNCTESHSVASGKKSTPTHKGVRVITHVEKHPYKSAVGSKRSKNPNAYGPYILVLSSIDPKTGKNVGSNGEFIHGNNNAASIGTYASGGCIRLPNDVITRLAKESQNGSYVIIQD